MATYPSAPIPDYPIEERTFYNVMITSLAGTEKTRAKHTTAIKGWALNYPAIHEGHCKYLWEFFNARKGSYESFTFVHPESAVSYTARFADDILKREEIGENLFDVEINLIEVI